MKKSFSILLIAIILQFLTQLAIAQNIFTYAGDGTYGYNGDGGSASAAQITTPYGICSDNYGNIFFVDAYNYRIRKVSPAGIITTVAGNGTAGYISDGVPATATQIDTVQGIAIDKFGNIYFSEFKRIRKIDNATGIISTIAGSGSLGFSGDGGPATSAKVYFPSAIVIDNSGNVIIADRANNRIRKIDTSGIITSIAGCDTGMYVAEGNPATNSRINKVYGLALDKIGDLYFSELTGRIRKINSAGIVIVVAGVSGSGTAVDGDGGAATAAKIGQPVGMTIDSSNNLFFVDVWNNYVRKVDLATGIITKVAGDGTFGYNGDGIPASSCRFKDPWDITNDIYGNLFITDRTNYRVRRVSTTVGINDINNHRPAISIFPNPTRSGLFTLDISSITTDSVSIVITNTMGQTVKELETPNDVNPIQLNVPVGIYYVTVITSQGKWYDMVVVGE